MSKLKFIFGMSVLMLLTSAGRRPATAMAGEYGVCGYESTNTNYLKLSLKADYTFRYIDKTNPEKPIDVKGTWKQDKSSIVLKDYVSEFPILRNGKQTATNA